MTEAQHSARLDVDARVDAADREIKKLASRYDKMERELQKANRALQKQGGHLDRVEDKMRRFDRAASKAQRAQAQLARSSSKGSSSLGSLAGAAGRVGLAAGALTGAVTAGVGAVRAWSEASLRNQQVFGNLGISLEKAKMATQGLVGSQELAVAANNALSLGVVSTGGEFADLARKAQLLGARVGLDATTALRDMTTALGRQSPRILDNLGIVLTAAEAQSTYSKKIGVAVDAMTDEQKKAAFVSTALERAGEVTKDVDLASDSAAGSIQRLSVAFEDLTTKLLDGEPPKRRLVDIISDLDDETRKLIDESKNFGASEREIKKILRENNAETLDMIAVTKALARVRRDERSAALDAELDGSAARKRAMEEQKRAAKETKEDSQEIITFLERELAVAEAKGEPTRIQLGLEQQILNTKADQLLAEVQLAEAIGDTVKATELKEKAEKLRFQAELKGIERTRRRGGRRKKKKKKEKTALELAEAAEFESTDDAFADFEELLFREERAAEAHQGKLIELEAARAQITLDQRMRSIEAQKAAGVDPVQLINAEEQARLEFIEGEMARAQQIEDLHERRLALMELENQREDAIHQARMQRSQQRVDAMKVVTEVTAFAANETVKTTQRVSRITGMAVEQGIVSEKRAAGFKAFGAGIANVATASEQAVKAAAAFASQNYGQGAAHASAATFAAVEAGLMFSKAASLGAKGGSARTASSGISGNPFSNEGATFGGEAGELSRQAGAANQGPRSSFEEDSIPASPLARTRQGGGDPGKEEKPQFFFLGRPSDDDLLRLRQMLQKSERQRKVSGF